MTRVEEQLDEENPTGPADLALQICPACKAEAKVGDRLVHADGCPRAGAEGEPDAGA